MSGGEEVKNHLVNFEKLPSEVNFSNFYSNDEVKTDYFLKECVIFQERNLINKTKFYISTLNELLGFFSLSFARFVMKVNKEKTFIPYLWVTNFGINSICTNNSKSKIEDFFITNIYKIGKKLSTIVGCRFIIFEVNKDLNKKILDKNLYNKLINYGFDHFPEECIYRKKEAPYSQIERPYRGQIILEKLFFDLRDDDSEDKWS